MDRSILTLQQEQHDTLLSKIDAQIASGRKNLDNLQRRNKDILSSQVQIGADADMHDGNLKKTTRELNELISYERDLAQTIERSKSDLINIQASRKNLQTTLDHHHSTITLSKNSLNRYHAEHAELDDHHNTMKSSIAKAQCSPPCQCK